MQLTALFFAFVFGAFSANLQNKDIANLLFPISFAEEKEAAEKQTENNQKEEENALEAQEEAAVNYLKMVKTTDVYGKEFDTSVFEGKPVMFNVWADWCGPCVGELPNLAELQKDLADKIVILGLFAEGFSVKDNKLVPNNEGMQRAVKLFEKLNIKFDTVIPDDILYELVASSSAVPTSWFFNENGQLVTAIPGAYSKEEWIKHIDTVLAEINRIKEEQGAAK